MATAGMSRDSNVPSNKNKYKPLQNVENGVIITMDGKYASEGRDVHENNSKEKERATN